jgi:hypothetical protein
MFGSATLYPGIAQHCFLDRNYVPYRSYRSLEKDDKKANTGRRKNSSTGIGVGIRLSHDMPTASRC